MNADLNCAISAKLKFFILAVAWLLLQTTADAAASEATEELPPDATAALHYLLELARSDDAADFEVRRIAPLVSFVHAPKPTETLYTAGASFEAPSAYNEFDLNVGIEELVGYTLDTDIPSFFFWPSSLRLSRWTRVDGGEEQFSRLRAAASRLDRPFILKGTEHIAITPDPYTGAYYSYDVDKTIILSPYGKGKLIISIYQQQEPSAVGKKGWVLGEDDEWSYLYTQEKGLNLKGLGWVNSYMYDSFCISVYYQPDSATPSVVCGVVSWVKAGWAGINMVQPKHIHAGLVRVAQTFTAVMENPRLPEPDKLARTFSKTRNLSTPTLKKYAEDYLTELKQRLESSETLNQKMGREFDIPALLQQMSREELYAVLALDYFKKILGRNPVMSSHPF